MKNSRKMLAVDLLLFVVLLAADQLTKHVIRIKLELHSYFNVIDKVLQIYHYENRGAAWGILQGQRVLFIIMAVVVACILAFVIIRIPPEKKYIRLNTALMMIAAGAIGNTIDRAMNGSVTDFIYVVLINFPIFNVADMYIVIATFWLVIMILFIYKDEELDFLSLKKKKTDESEEA
jgi:signal peptidase II